MDGNEFLMNLNRTLKDAEIEFGTLRLETKIDKIELDSISKMMIIQMIDESYSIEITAEDLKKCITINDLLYMIQKRKNITL